VIRRGISGSSSASGTVAWPSEKERRFVQQESAATGADLAGLIRTPWDGDLHTRIPVDVLPAYGMQEVRGSNPLSSTQAREANSKS
jgi:hypothetical protein